MAAIPSSLAARNPHFKFLELSPSAQAQRANAEFVKLAAADFLPATDTSHATARRPENACKNRYCDVLPIEATLFPPQPTRHYIGGNIIDATKVGAAPQTFVAAQAPLPSQFADFWSTVRDYRITTLVMLTREREGRNVKADRYWPRPGEGEFRFAEDATIANVAEEPLSASSGGIVCRRFVLTEGEKQNQRKTQREVRQYHYTGWPDFGVPQSTRDFLAMVEVLEAESNHKQQDQETSASVPPILVHCSAGIGRTGTLIAVYHLFHLARCGELDDGAVRRVVGRLKEARRGMVQKAEQYLFVYRCLAAELLGGEPPNGDDE